MSTPSSSFSIAFGGSSSGNLSEVNTSLDAIGPQLLSVLHESHVILFQQDRQLRYVWALNAFEGVEAADLVGCRDRDLLGSEAEVRSHEAAKMNVMRTGTTMQRELPVTIDGTTRYYDYTITPWHQDGDIAGVTCAAVDVTQRHRRERALQESIDATRAARTEAEREREEAEEAFNQERKRRREAQNTSSGETAPADDSPDENSKEMILGRAGHALHTPLTAILSQISVLEAMDLGKGEPVLKRLRRSADRLAQAVNEVLDLSRLEAGGPDYAAEPVSFTHLVLETVEMIRGEAEEKDVHIDVERPDEPSMVSVDPNALERVTSNLVENAVKYSDEGGTVRVRIHAPDDDQVCLVVEDDGIGISEEFREKLFQPFARSDEARRAAGGTGLGLAITLRLVQAMGGSIDVDSTPGEGSRFTVCIPTAK